MSGQRYQEVKKFKRVERAVHDHMYLQIDRLETFKEWKHSWPEAKKLSEKGFFYREDKNKLVCFCCDFNLRVFFSDNMEKFQSGDVPQLTAVQVCQLHNYYETECCLNEVEFTEELIPNYEESLSVKTLRSFEFVSEDQIKKAYVFTLTQGHQVNARDLLDTIHKNHIEKVTDEDLILLQPPVRNYMPSPKKYTEKEVENQIHCLELNKKIVKIEKGKKCKICADKEANMCPLPCGHISLCEDCVYRNNRCCLCQFLIRGVVKVY